MSPVKASTGTIEVSDVSAPAGHLGYKVYNRIIDWISSDRMQLSNVTERINEVVRKSGVKVGSVEIGNAKKLSVIAGPCQLESRAHAFEMVSALKEMTASEEAKITEITSLIRTRYPNAFLANFRGDAGVQPMEADLLAQLVPKLAAYATEPFPAPATGAG